MGEKFWAFMAVVLGSIIMSFLGLTTETGENVVANVFGSKQKSTIVVPVVKNVKGGTATVAPAPLPIVAPTPVLPAPVMPGPALNDAARDAVAQAIAEAKEEQEEERRKVAASRKMYTYYVYVLYDGKTFFRLNTSDPFIRYCDVLDTRGGRSIRGVDYRDEFGDFKRFPDTKEYARIPAGIISYIHTPIPDPAKEKEIQEYEEEQRRQKVLRRRAGFPFD